MRDRCGSCAKSYQDISVLKNDYPTFARFAIWRNSAERRLNTVYKKYNKNVEKR